MLYTEQECIDYIHSAGRFGRKAGLCNIKALLDLLGNPHKGLRCIHVAGTNGKGSVCSYLSAVLSSAGCKVGMNTSPYIEVFNERLTINGENIPGDKLIYYTNLVAEVIEKSEDMHPIEFEIITAIGFLYFKEEKCDYAIIECGIGGLFDSTNVIESPELCVITQLGLDHTEILGLTIEDIAYQKAGIIKENSLVAVHREIPPEALCVIQKVCKEKGAELHITSPNYKIQNIGGEETEFTFEGLEFTTGLLGAYQVSNASLAISCARLLGIDDDTIKKGIKNARWKCRFERFLPRVVIDGAHNIQGIKAFCDSVRMYFPTSQRVFVLGMLNDKDFDACAKELANLDGTFILTAVPSARQTDFSLVCSKMKCIREDIIIEEDYKKAVDIALEHIKEGADVFVAGSLYLAGAVRSYLS